VCVCVCGCAGVCLCSCVCVCSRVCVCADKPKGSVWTALSWCVDMCTRVRVRVLMCVYGFTWVCVC